jgi:hypothetical protein
MQFFTQVGNSTKTGPRHVWARFSGNLPKSQATDWLKTTPGRRENGKISHSLFDVACRAYCEAVKCCFDLAVMGDIEGACEEDGKGLSNSEVYRRLGEYGEESWHVGSNTTREWRQKVQDGFLRLFSLSKTNKGLVRSQQAVMTRRTAGVLRLNPSSVRSVWAGLGLELLY